MADYMHRTRLGALKASLVWGKTSRTTWEVEGRKIRRLGHDHYTVSGRGVPNASGIPGTGTTTRTLPDAFEAVADAAEGGGRR